jgi:hypothetical protein
MKEVERLPFFIPSGEGQGVGENAQPTIRGFMHESTPIRFAIKF